MLYPALLSFSLLATPAMETPKPATNGRCPVLGNPVANRNQSVAVRGRNYFICSSECGDQLTADPDKFLDKEGRPKIAAGSQSSNKTRDRY